MLSKLCLQETRIARGLHGHGPHNTVAMSAIARGQMVGSANEFFPIALQEFLTKRVVIIPGKWTYEYDKTSPPPAYVPREPDPADNLAEQMSALSHGSSRSVPNSMDPTGFSGMFSRIQL